MASQTSSNPEAESTHGQGTDSTRNGVEMLLKYSGQSPRVTLKESGASDGERACLDFYSHRKVEGLPAADPSSISMETCLRALKISFRVIPALKPTVASYAAMSQKKARGTVQLVAMIKNSTGIDLNGHLNDSNLSMVRLFTVALECQTYMCLLYHRWVDQTGDWKKTSMEYHNFSVIRSMLLTSSVRRNIRSHLEAIGIEHTIPEAVVSVLLRDLNALSNLLAFKEFFFGSQVSSLDCVCFGIVSSLVFCKTGSYVQSILEKNFTNLVTHCYRIKALYWPEWSKVVGKPRPYNSPRFFFSFRKPAALRKGDKSSQRSANRDQTAGKGASSSEKEATASGSKRARSTSTSSLRKESESDTPPQLDGQSKSKVDHANTEKGEKIKA